MTFRPMKPETIARREVERRAEQERRRARLVRDLREKVERDGPDSIWAEMLAETMTRHETENATAYPGKDGVK